MKLGVYTAILHDRPLADALDVIASLGLNAAEINAGGFLPPVHIPIDAVIASQTARDDYLGIFADKGVALAGLNANGNPLHPNPVIGEKHAADLKRAIRAARARPNPRRNDVGPARRRAPARPSPTGSSTPGTPAPSTCSSTNGTRSRFRSGRRSTGWPPTMA